jgi:hypothetical protein
VALLEYPLDEGGDLVFRRPTSNCTHTDQIRDVEPSAEGCEECLRTGDTWVHLRECLTCGHVGCCDASVSLLRRSVLSFRVTLSPNGSLDLTMVA